MKFPFASFVVMPLLAGCASRELAENPPGPRALRTYPDRIYASGALNSQNAVVALNGLNSPSMASAPTLAQPLTGLGRSAAAEISSGSGAILPLSIPRADEALRNAPIPPSSHFLNSGVADLPARVREALITGRPGSITRLTSERVERFEIDAANGTVTLRGIVQSETERLMIANRVAAMEGVRGVNNQLRVVPPARQGMEDPAGTSHPGALQGGR